jgi:hypothetical protein
MGELVAGAHAAVQRRERPPPVELIGDEGRRVVAGDRFDRQRISALGHADDPADLGAPLSYAVEILAADDEDLDLDPAAAALSKSRQWVLTALRAGGEL